MYYRFGIVCAATSAGLVSGRVIWDLKDKKFQSTEELVSDLDYSLSSVGLFGDFLSAVETAEDSDFMYELIKFLRSEDGTVWAADKLLALPHYDPVRSALERTIDIVNGISDPRWIDHGCLPPFAAYFGKELTSDEIKFVSGLFTSLDSESVEKQLPAFSRVTDYEKVFGPIFDLYHSELAEGTQEQQDMNRYRCFDGNILRRIATLRMIRPDDLDDVLPTPMGLIRNRSIAQCRSLEACIADIERLWN